jgi:hypothetical protein
MYRIYDLGSVQEELLYLDCYFMHTSPELDCWKRRPPLYKAG